MLLTSEVVGKIFFKDMIVVIQYLAEQAQDFKGDAANDYNGEDERIWIEVFAWIKACMWRENFRHEFKAANYEHAGNTTIFSKYPHVLFCENR